MSTDLRTRMDLAVGPIEPRPVDTGALWQRGRRQRRAKQATPVIAVLAIVGLGLGAVVVAADSPRDTGPVAPIEDGRDAGVTGWTPVPEGGVVTAEDVTVAAEDDVEVVAVLPGHPQATFAGFDVREDGAVLTVFHDRDRGGLMVRYPQDQGWTRLGMPAAFLEDDAGWAIHTLQWGPDGRIYVTGMAPNADARGAGLTQVAVLEDDGTVVGVRENDGGQTRAFLFAEGHAWQQQRSDPGVERWQPVAEIDGAVLQMPDQRDGEWEDAVAPDGMSLTYTWDGEAPARFEGRIGDRDVRWATTGGQGIGVWDHAPAGHRIGVTVPVRPAGGPLAWLSDETEPDGVVVHVLGRDGGIAAVHLPGDALHDPWGLVNGAEAVVARDGRLHWVTLTPDGPMLMRYRHPLP
ncbi:MAG: hypothetical protein KY461_00450 [Actinobacteria bacterium]|nr:hypothetical protein [Actinomycetota bacterium]